VRAGEFSDCRDGCYRLEELALTDSDADADADGKDDDGLAVVDSDGRGYGAFMLQAAADNDTIASVLPSPDFVDIVLGATPRSPDTPGIEKLRNKLSEDLMIMHGASATGATRRTSKCHATEMSAEVTTPDVACFLPEIWEEHAVGVAQPGVDHHVHIPRGAAQRGRCQPNGVVVQASARQLLMGAGGKKVAPCGVHISPAPAARRGGRRTRPGKSPPATPGAENADSHSAARWPGQAAMPAGVHTDNSAYCRARRAACAGSKRSLCDRRSPIASTITRHGGTECGGGPCCRLPYGKNFLDIQPLGTAPI